MTLSPVKNLIHREWTKGIKVEISGWSDSFKREKGVLLTDLALALTLEHEVSPLNFLPSQVRAVMPYAIHERA